MAQSGDSRRLSELTLGEAKRILVYAIIILLAITLFFLLVREVLVALLLGVVAASFLLPIQEWLEQRLRARSGSALITILLIVIPLIALASYGWYELSGYSNAALSQQKEIITTISHSLEPYIAAQNTRAGLEAALAEAVTRSGEAIQELREKAALLLASASIFFFTIFYVLTQRVRLAAYIKLRVPGDFLPLYEKLVENVGGALRGAVLAVMIDQSFKAVVILILNFVFNVPLAVALALTTFLIGFFPVLGEWVIYIPVSIYLLVFRHAPTAAGIYLAIGLAMTLSSSLILRPKLASKGAGRFNFYWMLVALVAGVYAFGIPGIVLGPAILGFAKAVIDTLVGEVKYETSLLREEKVQQAEEAARQEEETAKDAAPGALVKEAGGD